MIKSGRAVPADGSWVAEAASFFLLPGSLGFLPLFFLSLNRADGRV